MMKSVLILALVAAASDVCTDEATCGSLSLMQIKAKMTVGSPTTWTHCAHEGDQAADACYCASSVMKYGWGGHYSDLKHADESPCTNQAFGGDPIPGKTKSCYCMDVTWSRCAGEGNKAADACSCPTGVMKYGWGGTYFNKKAAQSPCTNQAFGGDPINGKLKSCYCMTAEGQQKVADVLDITIDELDEFNGNDAAAIVEDCCCTYDLATCTPMDEGGEQGCVSFGKANCKTADGGQCDQETSCVTFHGEALSWR